MELLEKLKILNNHLITKNYQKVIEGCTKLLKENPKQTQTLRSSTKPSTISRKESFTVK